MTDTPDTPDTCWFCDTDENEPDWIRCGFCRHLAADNPHHTTTD